MHARALNEAQTVEQAQEIAQRLGQAELRFDVKAGETGVLFGSVTQTNLADAIWDKLKVRVDRRKIGLDEPLKRIGRYQVPIELFAEVTVETRVLVVPEGGELPPEEELQAIEEAEAAEAAEAEALAEEEHAVAEVAIEEEIAAEEVVEEPEETDVAAEADARGRGGAEAEPGSRPRRSHKSRTSSPQASAQPVDESTKNPLAARNSPAVRVRRAGDDIRQAGDNRANVRSLALQAAVFRLWPSLCENRLSTR